MAAMTRTLFLDVSVGERRGVVRLRDRPERLLIERRGDPAVQRLGARVNARLRRVDRALGMAFLDLSEGPDAAAPAAALAAFSQGAAVEVEITAEPRGDKGAVVRVIGPGEGDAPRLLAPGPTLEERLKAFAPRAPITRGPDAREAAEEAQVDAMAVEHPLPDGGTLAIQRTRALTAIDVDLGARAGADAKRVARGANLVAIAEAARLLRLKGLGGLVVIDLAGRGHDGEALGRAAREAFAADQPDVSIGPISRFGTMELVKPWRERPVLERLCDASGRATAETAALGLARALEREGRLAGGARLTARAAPEVEAAFAAHRPELIERLGARFEVVAEPGRERLGYDISTA
jgi:Ribonuclease G/E